MEPVRDRSRVAVRAEHEELGEAGRSPYDGFSREEIMARQRLAWWKAWIQLADVLLVLAGGAGIAWILFQLILFLMP